MLPAPVIPVAPLQVGVLEPPLLLELLPHPATMTIAADMAVANIAPIFI